MDLIEVLPQPPTVAFTGVPLSGVAPLAVAFDDQTTGLVTARSWDFGDGNASLAEDPVHTYMDAGTYTVRLTVIGPGGNATAVRNDYVTVFEPPPSASFPTPPRWRPWWTH